MNRPTETPDSVTEQGGELIAFASTKMTGGVLSRARTRWTELAVWYLHNPRMGGKRWFARTSGYSLIEGEGARHTGLASGTLERALKLIDQTTDIGIATAETAREWAEDNRVTVQNGRGGAIRFPTDAEALEWLYGQPDEGHKGFVSMLAADTGAGESTIRAALAAGRDVKVPLRAFLPFIDRAAFRRARMGSAAAKIAAGLEDAIAYAEGDHSRGREARRG